VTQQPEQVCYASTGGVEVPALLLKPPEHSPGHSPAAVWVHGGPWAEAASDLNSSNSRYLTALLDAGFVILLPDYRGSTGHGEGWEWVREGQRGVVDVDDVVAGKRFLEESGLAAPGRVALAGYSYGGYLTCMALARGESDWACAASLWGLLNPLQMPDAWSRDQHGNDLPDLTDVAPLNYLHRMSVPLLILHGSQDGIATLDEVNQTQSALQNHGTPCEVRIFDDAHGLPLSTDKAVKHLVSFFRRYTSLAKRAGSK